MKQRVPFATVGLMLSLMLALAGEASAQHLISSKAGFVNRADGIVHVLRHDSEDGKAGRASLGTQLRDGDRLSTDANSRAEILLNPGSYLRLNENTEVRAVNTSFSETRFELLKGSAIVEIGQIDKKAPIELVTPNGPLSITKESTLIRVDAKTSATWVAVRQGEVYLGPRMTALADQGSAKIKRGKLVRLTAGSEKPELAKVDKDAMDNFDAWSFNRAQTLVAANLSSLRQNSLLSGGWYYNPFYGCYTFVPFGNSWLSAYGFGFYRRWADCYWYNPFGYGGYPYYYPGNNNNNGGGIISGGLPGRVVTGNDREPMRREAIGRGIDDSFGRSTGSRGIDGPDFGSRSVSSSAPSITSAPAATISSPAPERSSGGGGGAMPSRGNN
jgi:hypothetical protein